MRVFAIRPPLAVLGTALVSLAATLAADLPAAAQATTADQNQPQVAIRLGGFFTSNSTIKNAVGSSFLCAGLDYVVQQQSPLSRTIVSVDYIDRSAGGSSFRMFPVTIGQTLLADPSNDAQPYFGAGIGPYFQHEDFNRNNSTTRISSDNVVFGGYIGAGVEFHKMIDLDARYHIVTNSNGLNSSGLELTAGVRF